jgi:hypothetical protein
MSTLLLLLSLASAATVDAPADPPTEVRSRVTHWSPRHPFSMGVRGAWWGGRYQSGGFGGHVDLRPLRRLGVQAYADVFLSLTPELHRRDQVIGFDLYVPIGPAEKHWIAPTLGSCVDFRVFSQPDGGPQARDVRFGAHAGVKGHLSLVAGLGLEIIGTFTAYIGNAVQLDGWEQTTTTRFEVEPVAQVTTALTYTF